jgi:hypothetical protein
MRTLYFKRGNKFQLTVNLSDSSDVPIDVDVADMSSQIRDNADNLISELSIVDGSVVGEYILSTDDDTNDWPIQLLRCDIRMILNSNPFITDTFYIQTVKQETRV